MAALPIMLGLGIWGAGMKKRMDDAAEAKADREFEREERKRKRAEDEAVRKAAADLPVTFNAPGDGMGPSAALAGDGAYGTEQAAQAAVNSPEARIARQVGVLGAQGRTKEAFDLEKQKEEMLQLRKAITARAQGEGLNEFVDDNFAKAPSVEDVRTGKAGTFDLINADRFNKTGKYKIPEGSKGRWKVQELDNGREVVDFEVIGPDGQPVAPYSARTLQYLANYTVPQRDALEDKRFEQGVRLSQADRGLDIQESYRDGMVANASARSSGGGSGGSLEDRMGEADKIMLKIMLQGLFSRSERIESTIASAQENGYWDPNSAGAKDLLKQRARVEDQMRALVRRYSSAQQGGAPANADPLNLFGTPQQGQPAPAGGQGQGSDRFRIISAELGQKLAQRSQLPEGSPERKRLEGDILALQSELRALPSKERGQMPQVADTSKPAPASPSTPRQAAQTVSTEPQARRGIIESMLPTPKGSTYDGAVKERDVSKIAAAQGFEPTDTFGNGGLFGKPERMYENPKTGQRMWESQILRLAR